MNLAAILQEECIAVHVGLTDKESVLKYIARLAVKNPLLSEFDEKKIYQSLLDREKLGSTGFSNQIAIPHCALSGLKDFVLGILTVTDGIEFGSLD
ncbi:MAG: PTS sugar transporter subunit IIA, partial [Candidatus Cloacimonetes bacterium]|nr:PTS sugar transporter subunit IIA [Candidatus Cloacimonadota bacterium]